MKPSAAPPVESFAVNQPAPIDAAMWPLQPPVWLEPDFAPTPPVWSGLTIERWHRVPVPDFLRSGMAPFDRPGTPDVACDALAVPARPQFPESNLAPLGWDPRAFRRKEGKE